ncbi:hypothetical protein BH10PSE1_BH10PSE1_25870 [soil metagenome]
MPPVLFAMTVALLQASQTAAPTTEQTPVPATTLPPVSVTAPAVDPADRIVCRREHVMGSNRPQRICMTVRQRDLERDQAREFGNRVDGRSEVNSAPARSGL